MTLPFESDEAGSLNMPRPDGEEQVAHKVVDQIIERNARWERHTADLERKRAEAKPSRGAVWAWIAMCVLVGLYVAWQCWK